MRKFAMILLTIVCLPMLIVDIIVIGFGYSRRKQLDIATVDKVKSLANNDPKPKMTCDQARMFVKWCVYIHAADLRSRGFRVAVVNGTEEWDAWLDTIPATARASVASIAGCFHAMAFIGQSEHPAQVVVNYIQAWMHKINVCNQKLLGTDILFDARAISEVFVPEGLNEVSEDAIAWLVAQLVGHELRHTQQPMGWYATLQYINAQAMYILLSKKHRAERGLEIYRACMVEYDADKFGMEYANTWITK